MTAERLLGAVGDIRDDYVKEADVSSDIKVYKKIKWFAIAACLVVVALAAFQMAEVIFGIKLNIASAIAAAIGADSSAKTEGTSWKYPYERDCEYGSYEELAVDFEDPVFAAFAASDEAQLHDVAFATRWTRDFTNSMDNVNDDPDNWGEEYMVEALILLDRPGSMVFDASSFVMRYTHKDSIGDAEMRDQEFSFAADYNMRTDYMVDGIQVQKYEEYTTYKTAFETETGDTYPQGPYFTDESYTFVERVSISDVWYYVFSHDEATADAVATKLANIAAGM